MKRAAKKFGIIFGIIIATFILIGLMQRIAGAAIMIGTLGYGVYLFTKSEKFKARHKIIKTLSVLGLAFLLLIGSSLTFGEKIDTTKSTANTASSKVTVKDETKSDSEESSVTSTEQKEDDTSSKVSGELKVHFINVGQADSILVQQGSNFMLIDAGNNTDANTVKNYLDSQGVKELYAVVGTHPHEDHIGGLDYIINSFKIGKIYMPKATSTTKTFEDVVKAVEGKNMQATAPTPGDTFNLGDAKCTILAPNSGSYDDLNNYSIVIKVEFGSTSFLLDGDAEEISEKEMLDKGFNLKADVLKVGHHGSTSSTSPAFLSAVSPKYAVISVGKNNDYGHPAQSTMDKLKTANISVFRTDEQGTIVATSNGKGISFNVSPGSYTGAASTPDNSNKSDNSTTSSNTDTSTNTTAQSQSSSAVANAVSTPSAATQNNNRTVYWTPGGKSYHYTKDCPTLSRSKTILEGPLSSCPKSDPCDKCTR